MPVPDTAPFSYLIVRCVPDLDRGECVNVGVALFCRQRDGFLELRVTDVAARLRAFGRPPSADVVASIGEHLAGLVRVAAGDPAAGPIAALPASERFGWLAAPQSTIVQPSEVHTGLTADPAATLEALFARLVV